MGELAPPKKMDNIMLNSTNQNFAQVSSTLHVCQIMAQALPSFFQRTKISASFIFKYDHKESGVIISFGFEPKPPSDQELSILIEEIIDAEKILFAQEINEEAKSVGNIEQLIFRLTEEAKQALNRRRKNGLKGSKNE